MKTILNYMRACANQFCLLACVLFAYKLGFVNSLEGTALVALSQFGYANLLVWQKAAGTAFNTYTAAKSVINVTELYQFPPNYLYAGKKLRITAKGALSSIVTTPGSVTFQIMMGSIVVWTSGAVNLTTTGNVSLPFTLVVDLRLDSVGSGTAAKFLGMGVLSGVGVALGAINSTANSVITDGVIQVPITGPAVGTGFDSTIANILDFWVGFSISQPTNGVQLFDYTVEELN